MQTYQVTAELASSAHRGASRFAVSPHVALRDERRVGDFLESHILDPVGSAPPFFFLLFLSLFPSLSLLAVEHLSHMNNWRVYRGVWETWW